MSSQLFADVAEVAAAGAEVMKPQIAAGATAVAAVVEEERQQMALPMNPEIIER